MTSISDYTLELDGTPWRLVVPDSANSDWCVLWLQGFTSTVEGHTDGVIRMSEATNTAFALLDYAGHGTNPIPLEQATRHQQHDEVVAVYDELVKRGYKHIIASGGSFGGYMAALLAGKRDLAALMLRAPANYTDDEFELPYNETSRHTGGAAHNLYRQNIDMGFRNTPINAVESYGGLTYVVEHGEDEVIHSSIPKSYFNAAKHGNYIVIPNLKHAVKRMPNPEHYHKLVEMWVEAVVNATRHEIDSQ